ncbi:MAG: prolipoprotein diacylglyceryl transferase [Eubacterium sp.]|nr:prolipoprotein diacylglyceryl transferase [Eubacterium sp.]MBR7060669.1 prolipoprotein diacylglyceryl transferase [Eubacterium sp.]
MSDFTHVYFDGLGIDFNLPSVAFSVFGHDIHFYGLIIAFGFALAVLYGGRGAYKWKMSLDGMTDVLLWGTIFGIVGARAYYVAFEWEYYSQHLNEIPAIWNGGIAIYGGIIGALIGAAIGCKIGKINYLNLLDLGALGLLIGQGIGRWGNFFNQEAFGTNTETALFRMWSPKIKETLAASAEALSAKGIDVDPAMPVHPTFLYESVWCLLSFLILHIIVNKKREFKGEIFMLYGVLYGAERMIVEGMRTDSLYIGNTTLRVSQLLSMIIVVVALAFFIFFIVKAKKGTLPEKMLPIIDDSADKKEDDELSSIVVESANSDNSEEKENADN